MKRYLVEFYINGKVVEKTYRTAAYRRGAYFEAIDSPEHWRAAQLAREKGTDVMWDATEVGDGGSQNQ